MFSVLVANYNHGKLVARAVESVLAQDYPAELREVIVVDDGSTDDSRQRLEPYRNTPGVSLVFLPNRGQTAAFAAALAQARGDYVCLLDADDRCLPAKLRRLAEYIATLDTSPERLFLCHDLQILDGADGPPIASTWFEVVALRRMGPQLSLASAHHEFPFSMTSGMVYGRLLLQRLMDEVPQWEWRMGADAILGHAAMILVGDVQYLHEPLGSYVVHGGNDLASVEDGRFVAKPVWHGRWPRNLRFLELLVDSLPLTEPEREVRLGYISRLEHATRSVPSNRRHTLPLLSFVVDASTEALAAHAQATHDAIAALVNSHHELIWICTTATQAALPEDAAARCALVPQGSGVFARMRHGLEAARGGYLCFLDAGDLPDRRFSERHLQAQRYGMLPMLTASDVRLLDAVGAVIHPGIMGLAAGWGHGAPQVPAFAGLLRDWALSPLPAIVLRRTAFLEAFFRAPDLPLPDRQVPWLLCQYLLQMGGATRLAENLMDLRLPPQATPNASWLSQFVDRHGPLPQPDYAHCAEVLFTAYARARSNERAFFAENWEARFLRWLVQSGGADVPARIERQAQRAGDEAWAARISALLVAAAKR